MRKTLLLLLLTAGLAGALRAQRYAFKNFTTNDGLVQTDVTDIKQDKKGFIWIGTNGGLSVYDGKKFTNYDDNDVLQSLRINALLCDNEGTMWIATRNGLLCYNGSFRVFFKSGKGRLNDVACLTTDAKNNLAFVCNNKAYRIQNGSVRPLVFNGHLEDMVELIGYDREDNLWIVSTDKQVYKKTEAGLRLLRTPFTQKTRLAGLGFLKILGKEGPEPFFVTNFGTFCPDGDSLCFFYKKWPQYEKAKIGQATYVLQRSDTSYWVGGVMGLSKLSPYSTTRYAAENGFCDNSVSCLFSDREQNLWVGCTYNGVYRLGNEALFQLQHKDMPSDLRHVSDAAPLADGRTLLATWGRGLFLLEADSVRKVPLPSSLRYITSMIRLGDAVYFGWFGRGLWKLQLPTLKAMPVKGFAEGEAVGSLQKTGKDLLVITLNGRCYLTTENFVVKARADLAESETVVALNDEIFRVNASGQVDLLDKSLQPVRKNLFPEISSRITEIQAYRQNFLISTFGQGLFLYSGEGRLLRRLDKKSGLPTNIVTSLLIDGDQVYAGTNQGLLRLQLPDLQNLRVFKESEGLFSWECRTNGLTRLPNGSFLIATTNGPYLYYPDRDASQQQVSGVLSVACFAAGQNGEKHMALAAADGNLKLADDIAYGDNTLAVTLKGVSQRFPKDIVYHYQLNGYDTSWVSTTKPQLQFRNLAPGEYKLKAYLSIGSYQSKPLQIAFAVARPLSGTWWFQLLLVLVLSALCWVLLTVGNGIYQKYIQTRMIGQLQSEVAVKQELTGQALSFARQEYRELSEVLRQGGNRVGLDCLTPVFLKDVGRRIELLWKKDKMSLQELHRYFEDLLADYDSGARLYHKLTMDGVEVPVAAAFHLMQVFSLYLFIGLYESGAAVFGLDAENKSNGQLLLRLYNVTHEKGTAHPASYHLLKETINRRRNGVLMLDVIENLEFGNMLVAELNLQNQHTV